MTIHCCPVVLDNINSYLMYNLNPNLLPLFPAAHYTVDIITN